MQIHPVLIGQTLIELCGELILYRLHNSKTFGNLAERILTPSDTDLQPKVP